MKEYLKINYAPVDACGILIDDIDANCHDVNVPGIDDVLYIFNHSQIDKTSCHFDPTNPKICDDIVVKTDSPVNRMYSFEGKDFSNEASQVFEKTDNGMPAKQTVIFKIWDIGPETSKIIDDLRFGKYLIIVKNLYNNKNATTNPSSSIYEMYGFNNGLILKSAVNNKKDFNGWVLTFETHERAPEQEAGMFFFATDDATTETYLGLYLAGDRPIP